MRVSYQKLIFSLSIRADVVGIQNNRFIEMVLSSVYSGDRVWSVADVALLNFEKKKPSEHF